MRVEGLHKASGHKKTRGRAFIGDPLALLTVVMKNYYETIISFSVSSF